jgi:pimeloyl-ACP methyl ester carboxylesterase
VTSVDRLESSFVCRFGCPLRYVVSGSGRPLVLINAYGVSDDFWTPLADELARSFTVITWNIRGLDDAFDGREMRVADHVDDLVEILDRCGFERADVVGWCSGAKIAIAAASLHPEYVRAQTLLCPNVMPLGDGFETCVTPLQRNLLTVAKLVARRPELAPSIVDSIRDLEAIRGTDGAELEVASPQVKALIMQPFVSSAGVRRYAAMLLDYYQYDVRPMMAALSVPTLVVAARQDRIVDPRIAIEAARRIRDARLAVMDESDHHCPLTDTARIASAIRAFHCQLPERAIVGAIE